MQERTGRQEDQDEQVARQMQADEQQRADHPIQLGPPKSVLIGETKEARDERKAKEIRAKFGYEGETREAREK